MNAVPLTLKEANQLVARWHRHSKPVVGARFAIGVTVGGALVGAVIVFRQHKRFFNVDLAKLRGKDLVCWCAEDQPCHADVLLEWANAPEGGAE